MLQFQTYNKLLKEADRHIRLKVQSIFEQHEKQRHAAGHCVQTYALKYWTISFVYYEFWDVLLKVNEYTCDIQEDWSHFSCG